MHLFRDGRAPFLEFLRNLTPQTFVLSIAIVAGYKLQPTCCYIENTRQTTVFIFFSAIWVAALWANSSLFVEKYLISVNKINRFSKRLVRQNIKGFQHFKMLIVYAWRYKRIIFLELLFVGIVLEMGMTAVVAFAIGNSQLVADAVRW